MIGPATVAGPFGYSQENAARPHFCRQCGTRKTRPHSPKHQAVIFVQIKARFRGNGDILITTIWL
jgi:hypothetical protein